MKRISEYIYIYIYLFIHWIIVCLDDYTNFGKSQGCFSLLERMNATKGRFLPVRQVEFRAWIDDSVNTKFYIFVQHLRKYSDQQWISYEEESEKGKDEWTYPLRVKHQMRLSDCTKLFKRRGPSWDAPPMVHKPKTQFSLFIAIHIVLQFIDCTSSFG